jgi:hypothetical protein
MNSSAECNEWDAESMYKASVKRGTMAIAIVMLETLGEDVP